VINQKRRVTIPQPAFFSAGFQPGVASERGATAPAA
jgi:hypothetical protein